MYHETVWFAGGLPQGNRSYMKSFQMSYGCSMVKSQLKRRGWGTVSPREIREGMRSTEVSALLNALQWKVLPFSNRKEAFCHLRSLALEEVHSIFLAPVLEASVQLSRLEEKIYTKCISRADAVLRLKGGCGNEPNYVKIVQWAFPLADELKKHNRGRIPPGMFS
eukprot:CAMPEP_0194343706 /NCGR_PEP_ID=MMETSP0171-20130528/98265_1 /TAXON_ID=218684 /ORGANISM="Corethron pennatum, Strain L29A3" /LENGTH=164 /DNA_ID=CAMNT_0039110059 /DNA_START=1 /DNA_END=492 /DNA_ORIENTATION=-